MLATLAMIVVGALACSDRAEPLGPRPLATSTLEIGEPPNFTSDSLQVIHGCGQKFYIRSARDTAITIKWQTWGTGGVRDSGVVTLPPRTAGTLYSSTLITSSISFNMAIAITSDGQRGAHNQGTPPACVSIPALVPDSIPVWFKADTILVSMPSRYPALYTRDVVMIRFLPAATHAQKEAAVASAGGRVVGGIRFEGIPGFYAVQLPRDTTNVGVFDAIDILNTLPGVRQAMVYSIMIAPSSRLKPKRRCDIIETGSRDAYIGIQTSCIGSRTQAALETQVMPLIPAPRVASSAGSRGTTPPAASGDLTAGEE
jgi:hypothetical protein